MIFFDILIIFFIIILSLNESEEYSLPVAHKLWSTPKIYDFFDPSKANKSDHDENKKIVLIPEKDIPM